MHFSTVQYSALHFSTVHCSTVQYSTVHCSRVHCSTVQCSSVQYNALPGFQKSMSNAQALTNKNKAASFCQEWISAISCCQLKVNFFLWKWMKVDKDGWKRMKTDENRKKGWKWIQVDGSGRLIDWLIDWLTSCSCLDTMQLSWQSETVLTVCNCLNRSWFLPYPVFLRFNQA